MKDMSLVELYQIELALEVRLSDQRALIDALARRQWHRPDWMADYVGASERALEATREALAARRVVAGTQR